MVDVNEHDRFVVIRRRRTPLDGVDIYEFTLADADAETPAVCHVRQSVSRFNEPIGFYVDEAQTVALMHLNPRPRFNPWGRYELTDTGSCRIGAVQKAFVPRRHRSHYILYDRDGDEVACVEAHVPAAVSRRRAGGVAVASAAGAMGIPFVGAASVAAVASLAMTVAAQQIVECVDPIEVASELRILRGNQTVGILVRQPLAGSTRPGTPPIALPPWGSPTRVYEIDLSADSAKTVDRRLVLAMPVAVDALRGVLAEVPLR